MYFISHINQNIYLPCIYFEKSIKSKVISSLLTTVEGNKTGPFGLVIVVVEINNCWNRGKLLPGSSSAFYNISYKALTFRAFRGEILNAIVTNITKLGFFCESGSLQIFISKQFIPRSYQYNDSIKCFQNYVYENDKIKKDTLIRVRIIGLREDSNYTQAIGNIDEKYLGCRNVNIKQQCGT
nr:RNA polymerase II RPB7 subunit-like protein [Cryptomonas sp.]